MTENPESPSPSNIDVDEGTTGDTDADTRDTSDSDRVLEEGVHLFGETGRESSPGDKDHVWESFALDTDQDYGVETTGTAQLSEDARNGAKQAIAQQKVPNESLAKATTTQQESDKEPLLTDTVRGFIRPPYDPTALANLAQKSGTHKRCIHAKAQGVAGNGFSVVPHEHHADINAEGNTATGDSDQPDGLDDVRDFWFGRQSTFQLGPNRQLATPEEVLKNVMWDYEGVGWGCLEILVNRTGDPTGLAHVPAHRIRKRTDAPGYVELDTHGQIRQYYSEAGLRYPSEDDDSEQVFVDRWTGETANTRQGVSEVANELLFLQNYNPLTPHYGLPDVVPEIQTIVGDLAARRYNARFFENDGVPRFVVAIEGGELTDRAFESLSEKLKELSKEENTHRGMLIEAVDAVQAREGAGDVSISIEPLTVGEQEDASFIDFRKENEHDIIKAHSVPPVVVSRTEGSNYANSREQRQEFAQDTIRPRQQTLASRLHRTLHAVMLDAPGVTLDFNLRGGQNRKREAEISQIRLNAGGMSLTVNEWREELGKPPLTTESGEPDPVGEMLMVKLQSMGAMGGGGGGGSDGSPQPSPSDTGTPTDDPSVQAAGSVSPPAPASSQASTEAAAGVEGESPPPYSILADGEGAAPTKSTDFDSDSTTDEDDMDVNITINASDSGDDTPDRVELRSDAPNHREAAATSKYAEFEQGDMVSYGSGDQQNGLVLEVFTGEFEWPAGDGEPETVPASQDNPVYVVARATRGSGVYEESELEERSFLEDVEADPSELADAEPAKIYDAMDDPNSLEEFRAAQNVVENLDIPGVDDPGIGFDSGEPDGWTRLSFLKAWRSLGMTWTSCVADMSGDVRSPKKWCSALKDTIFGTTYWRSWD